jgi:hypothetical protein
VLASFDGGVTFRWMCEEAIGFSGTWDPPLAVTPDHRVWMGLEHGLAWTEGGCEVQRVAALDGELVSDLTRDGTEIVAVTSTPSKPPAFWRGAARVGTLPSGFYLDTIDVAARRAYVTGTRVGERPSPHLFRSDDAGRTWTESRATWPTSGRLYLAAIDPKDPNRVFVRQLSEKGSDLLLSEDGGVSFRGVVHMAGAMFGFAESPDGSKVWAGSGDADEGLVRSTDRGRTFTPAAKATIFCLHDADRLYTCSNPFQEHGYALGVSTDEGTTVTPLLGFADVLGPVACDAGAGALCEKSWPAMHATFATQIASSAPSAAPSSAPSAAPESRPARSGCGCDLGTTSSGWVPALGLLVALLGRRLDRKRTSGLSHPRP